MQIAVFSVFIFYSSLMGQQISLVGQYDTPGWSRDVYVKDDYAYVADYDGGLRIIDVSNPSNPQEASFCFMPGNPFGVFVKDNYAYISCDITYYFCIVDVTNPLAPLLKSYVPINGPGYNVYVSGNYAYLAVGSGAGGLYIYDVSNPLQPQQVGSFLTYSSIGVCVVDSLALLAAGYLYSVDVSNPYNPHPLDSFYETYDEYAYDVCAEGDYAYCVFDYANIDDDMNDNAFKSDLPFQNSNGEFASMGGLRIIDISTPTNISQVGYVYTSMDAFGVCVNNDFAYTAGWVNDGIQATNVGIPTNPFIVATYNTPGQARDLFFYDNLIYLADGQSGLEIYRVPTGDSIPPVIDSTTQFNDTCFAGPFVVTSKVSDNVEVESVSLFYKRIEDPVFHELSMSSVGGQWFSAEIPQAYIDNDTIKYYVWAEDISSNVSTDPNGAPQEFYQFIAKFTVGVEEEPLDNVLNLIFTNIHNRSIEIQYFLKEASHIEFKIFDTSGRLVCFEPSVVQQRGHHQFLFNTDKAGKYFLIFNNSGSITQKGFIVF